MRKIVGAFIIAAALTVPISVQAVVTTTAIAAGTTDWADLGIPSAGSVIIVQPTNADILFAVADVKPSIAPPIGFHLDPKDATQITLNTPAATHVWAIIPSRGVVVSTGGYVIVVK